MNAPLRTSAEDSLTATGKRKCAWSWSGRAVVRVQKALHFFPLVRALNTVGCGGVSEKGVVYPLDVDLFQTATWIVCIRGITSRFAMSCKASGGAHRCDAYLNKMM